MRRHDPRTSLRLILAAALVLGTVPACNASGFRWRRGQVAERDESGNIVYRPVYPPQLPRPKEIYPGGYAGTVYPPLGTGRAVSPTEYRMAPDGSYARPHKWWHGWR